MHPVLFVFLFFGPAALLLGGGLALVFGSRASRVAGLCGLGVLIVLAVVVAVIATSPTTSHDCWECTESFGRWFSPLIYLLAFYNLVGCVIAVIGGTVMRRALSKRPRPGPLAP